MWSIAKAFPGFAKPRWRVVAAERFRTAHPHCLFLSSRHDDRGNKNEAASGRSPEKLSQRGRNNQRERSNSKAYKKDNFDRRILHPAQQGKLSHEKQVPRLIGKRNKARLEPEGRPGKFDPDRAVDDPQWDDPNASNQPLTLLPTDKRANNIKASPPSPKRPDLTHEIRDDPRKNLEHDVLRALSVLDESDDKFYWREEEFDDMDEGPDIDIERDDDGEIEFAMGDEDRKQYDLASRMVQEGELLKGVDIAKMLLPEDDDGDDSEDDSVMDIEKGAKRVVRRASNVMDDRVNPEDYFFFDQNDVVELAALSEKDLKSSEGKDDGQDLDLLPLRDHGPNLDEFLEAMMEHPTKYAHTGRINLHPDSQREPKPDFPPNRAQPLREFVESHARFLYVTGLSPSLNADSAVAKGGHMDPVQRDQLQKTVARIVGVDSKSVHVANTTSAFVGFQDSLKFAESLRAGPSTRFLTLAPAIATLCADEDHAFAKDAPGCVVMLSNMPSGHTSISLARELFPAGTKVGKAYRRDAEHFQFLSKSMVLLKFDSAKQAQSALTSDLVRQRLEEFGRYRVRYQRARRELVHDGFTGPNKAHEKRKLGPRLVVDGDMPSKALYLSHARVVHIRNVDPCLSKARISDAFAEHSSMSRIQDGSVEFVECNDGLKTGSVYIGFDKPGEAETCIRALSGQIKLGDRVSRLRLVQDRQIPRHPLIRPETRPDRTADELVKDLNGWEHYVSQQDLDDLKAAGIRFEILDDALRAIRFSNATFGTLDEAVRSEALQPNTMSGDLYRELVELYVAKLKECIATPENVGSLYESLHFPDEPIDLSIFDTEKERQARIDQRRSAAV